MSSTPNYDAKIKAILDATKPGERICELTGEKWQMSEEEIGWYRRFNIPPSKISPSTNWKLLGYFDASYQFWWNKHFETGEPVLSFHHPGSGIRVLPDTEWYNRDFSSITYDYKKDKSFFDQMRIFEKQIPFLATYNVIPPEHSLTLVSLGDKDSYFVFASKSIHCFYSTCATDSEDSSLIFLGKSIIKSHHVLHSERLFNCRYVRESRDCMDSCFLFDCRNCKNCFGATNKRNREYLWFNEQLSKQEWEKRRSEVDLGKRSIEQMMIKQFESLLLLDTVWPENFNEKTESSTGEYLTNAIDCSSCFFADGRCIHNYQTTWLFGDSQDNAFDWCPCDSRGTCFCALVYFSNELKFCFRCRSCDTCEYCMMCTDCKNCFACIGLSHKQFHIFNKPYSEEEYWKRIDEIKCLMLDRGEYGKFFPPEFSSAYPPEGGSVIYCGVDEAELSILGGNKFDPNTEGATKKDSTDLSVMRQMEEVPDSIDDLIDDWIGVPIYDKNAGRTFSFLKPEVEYYREFHLPPPNTHFIRRVHEVSQAGQLAILEDHFCAQCKKTILTSKNKKFAHRKIYCKSCYLKYLEENG
ncbi:hypothetical protein CO172_01910 [Candidatus Uhrbacteria bacterium CG_4_9_14_3_um_filter_36_7]|uniref:Caib/baif family protein n=1 Tax=Candidatus Uhrbacteria bacterium CG_4_9_14_3_um_filter_36_7 TaxID=1975033 RepID=A0A2M7XHK5_9BACT|nr:MAG: hypothetical protein CO172_01910 [Candidatus Uhrbacteria bacterium CG_4_9_14_3_um_filter_36_7]